MGSGWEQSFVSEKPNFDVIVSREGDVTVATLKGPVDSATLDLFQDRIGPLCTAASAKVLLDCRDLTYINSRAIGLLMKYNRGLQVGRGQFAMSNLNPKLMRTLELLQIGKTLSIYASREEALAALK